MREKINELMQQYEVTLKRKQMLLQPLVDKKNSIDDEWTIVNQENYSRLKAETEMLIKHIEDLRWVIE